MSINPDFDKVRFSYPYPNQMHGEKIIPSQKIKPVSMRACKECSNPIINTVIVMRSNAIYCRDCSFNKAELRKKEAVKRRWLEKKLNDQKPSP
jgi:late competence protein required for DNA uptake (superfamily II DNA/RNA helicase)